MTIIWQKTRGGKQYQVRAAGASRRLYTDGVFHSQFNPKRVVTGSVWDLLMLPAYFYPPGTVQRVLVLGVGGGTVIRQLTDLLQPRETIGVELNPVHLHVARRFFGIDREHATLYESDAVQWLGSYDGPPFDMIIDDLFGEVDGEPVRAVDFNARWISRLLRHLAPAGAVVANFASPAALRQSAYFTNRQVAGRFKAAFQLSHPLNENAVGAFLRRECTSRQLRANLRATPALAAALRTGRLRYRIRRIEPR